MTTSVPGSAPAPAEDSHRYAVILAGGQGTRLWPVSTTEQPKQFQALGDSRPLITQTFDRLAACVPDERIYVSTTRDYVDDVVASLPRLRPENLVVEPQPQGKPAAFLLVASRLSALDPQAVVLSAAADSAVSPVEAFERGCEQAFEFVGAHPSWTTLLGSRPTRPDISLGYVRATGTAMGVSGIHVARDFHEKPTLEVARTFAASPEYFWNSSHYCFAAATLVEAYRQAAPQLWESVRRFVDSGEDRAYVSDARTTHELHPFIDAGWPIGVVESEFRWYDIGTWPSLYRALADSKGTSLISSGACIDVSSEETLVVNDSDMTVITAGLDGLAVVVSDSVVLVAPIKKLEEEPTLIASLQLSLDDHKRAETDK